MICIGVILGPKQPKDINSFFIPLLNELLELQDGVSMHGLSLEPEGIQYGFVLHVFIIIIFGDIPAISKLMMMKGHNAFLPCHTCLIEGQLCQLKQMAIYYVPLRIPGNGQECWWNHKALLMQTHEQFVCQFAKLSAARTQAEHEEIA